MIVGQPSFLLRDFIEKVNIRIVIAHVALVIISVIKYDLKLNILTTSLKRNIFFFMPDLIPF